MRTPPPPPPSGSVVRRYLYPATLATTIGLVAYFYVNKEDDTYEYWRAMQSGQVMPFDEDDDEDVDEDEDEDDDE
eukprot:CAMPEP_0172492170 /NCGR_PEP_ID=MMETSP1066-20121228/23213_1 /TAXON_ID=671091 /ORGANISM="Coscinodiscus wailesii, Strain CCMP2513" /LENGTH=74 /DNA_ID=CAMNT_0013261633 /DNA_START=407 /DNA_END=631 /DNA_ORIENTATION=-